MIDSLSIYKKADTLVNHCGTRNPEKIAEILGIEIFDILNTQDLIGMYYYNWKMRAIFLNTALEEQNRMNIIAHELGHDQLHRELAKEGLQEYTFFDMKTQTEYEANAFASHVLLDTQRVIEYAKMGYDIVQMAKGMNTHINMMLIKVNEINNLSKEGKLKLPWQPDPTFFRNVSKDYGRRTK